MSIGSVFAKIGRFLIGAKVVGWFKNELDKSLLASADAVAKKYGDLAAQCVKDAEGFLENGVSLSDSDKLWKAVGDLGREITSKGGPAILWGTGVIVIERAYLQFKQDAQAALTAAAAAI